jgi:alditol oxidase
VGSELTANWAGNYVYRAREIVAPRSVEELQECVARSARIGFLGSRHSFNAIADSEVLVATGELPSSVEVDGAGRTATLSGGIAYGALALELARQGLALANLASLPHISVAGAISTASHGSGDRNGNLASAVAALTIVRADGEAVRLRRGDPDFDGAVVGLGALGAIVEVTLDVEPAFDVRQRVFEGMPIATLLEHFDAVMAAGYSVSCFTRWDGIIDQVWVKTKVVPGEDEVSVQLPGATPATANLHVIRGLDPINCTPQLGVRGPWFERLPHFRMGFTPSNGDEIQSEFLLARAHAREALAAVQSVAERIRPVLQISEIRSVAADSLWMSPQYQRDSVGVHFTWVSDRAAVQDALRDLEAVLAPFAPRPHWGKVFLAERGPPCDLYPRAGDFLALASRYDPQRAFSNEWLERNVFGRI